MSYTYAPTFLFSSSSPPLFYILLHFYFSNTSLLYILLHLYFLNTSLLYTPTLSSFFEHFSSIYSYTSSFLTPLFYILLHFSFSNTSLLYTLLLCILFFYIYFSNTSFLHCSTLSSVPFNTSVLIIISLSSLVLGF